MLSAEPSLHISTNRVSRTWILLKRYLPDQFNVRLVSAGAVSKTGDQIKLCQVYLMSDEHRCCAGCGLP